MNYSPQTRREFFGAAAAVAAAVRLRPRNGRAAAAPSHTQIDTALRQATEHKDVPGVVAMAANDKGIIYEGAFGTRDLVHGPEMTLDTVFRLASMTKAVNSVAAMQLVEQGKLRLRPTGRQRPPGAR